MCPADRQKKDDKMARRETTRDGEIDSELKTNSIPQQDVVFSLKLFRLVFWADSVWYLMIYRNRSWYYILYHTISQDTICQEIASISRNLGTGTSGDLVSRQNISRYRTLFGASNCIEGGARKTLKGLSNTMADRAKLGCSSKMNAVEG